MGSVRVVVVTSTRYLWAISPFAYLFNTYWSALHPVTVVGFRAILPVLPSNFSYFACSQPDTGSSVWSTALLEYLNSINEGQIVLMLDDYWLTRTADNIGINTLRDYMVLHPEVLKIDLTDDRLYSTGDGRTVAHHEYWGHYDLVYSPFGTPYRMSLQSAIWDREKLISLIQNGMNPWQVEIYIEPPPEMVVLGTRQHPLRYCNAIYKGHIVQEEVAKIPEPHQTVVRSMIPNGWEVNDAG